MQSAKCKSQNGPLRIDLHDVTGRLVREWQPSSQGNDGVVALHTSLDLSGLANGVYYVSVRPNSTVRTTSYRAKIVLER
jgi:hypothetical protein